MFPDRWLRHLPFSSGAIAQRLDARLPDLSSVGPVLFDAKGVRAGTLSAHARLQCADVPALVAEILGSHSHLMVAPDGVVAWRSPAHFGAGDTRNLKAMAHDALADRAWASASRPWPRARPSACAGRPPLFLGSDPSVRE